MRLIDADALRFWTAHHVDEAGYIANFAVVSAEDIENAPTIDAEPVKHGHWECNLQYGAERCSECGACYAGISRIKYCPECGAKMDGKSGNGQEN